MKTAPSKFNFDMTALSLPDLNENDNSKVKTIRRPVADSRGLFTQSLRNR